MKRKTKWLLSFTLCVILMTTLLPGCGKKDGSLTKVRLNEVVRSVFYAPMYVALNKNFFKDEGLNIELSTGQGADKTMQQVMSKSADIGFCGPEQVIYIYNQGREDYPVLFAQCTQTDGSFLVSRKDEQNFKWESLKGKTIIGGRPGGVPEMALEYVLKKHGLNPTKDVNLITNLAFTATAGAFKTGTGDYVALFEPTASMLEKEKSGYIVSSVGQEAGTIAYTCFFTAKSYMDKNKGTVEKFTRALYKGQQWVDSHTDEEVAKAIISFFPGTDTAILTNVVKNYRGINAFAHTPLMSEAGMNMLMDIITDYKADLIPSRPPFSKIVNTSIAQKIIDEGK